MNTTEVLALYDRQQRIDIDYPRTRKEVLPHLTRFVTASNEPSFILHSRLQGADVDAVIREQIAYFAGLNQRFEWKAFDHDFPPDLKERLVAHGLEMEGPDAVMVLDLAQAPAELLASPAATVRRLTTATELQDVTRIGQQVWEENYDWLIARLAEDLGIPGFLSVYAAYVDQEPASAGWIYFHPNSAFASLWGGSTVAAFRNRGLYTAVLAARAQEAIRRGCRFLTIDAGDMSRPIAAKHGFQTLTHTHSCNWKPAGAS